MEINNEMVEKSELKVESKPEDKTEIKAEDPRVSIDFPKFILTSIADQIKQADTKAVGVLSILGIVTAALLGRLKDLKIEMGGIQDPMWLFVFGVSLVMIVLCMKFIIRVVYPRDTKVKNKTMIYFKDIADLSQTEYVKKGKSLYAPQILDEMYGNTHNLAKLATSKYKALRQAMQLTTATIIWTIAVLLL